MKFQNLNQRLEFIACYSTEEEYCKFLTQLSKVEDLNESEGIINYWFTKIRYDVDMGVRK